jgi:diguanylate cyclase (GGDEF)-like protein/PAS domain S-box-containing protein
VTEANRTADLSEPDDPDSTPELARDGLLTSPHSHGDIVVRERPSGGKLPTPFASKRGRDDRRLRELMAMLLDAEEPFGDRALAKSMAKQIELTLINAQLQREQVRLQKVLDEALAENADLARAFDELQHRFTAVTVNASDFTTVIDLSGRRTFVTESVRSVLGYEPEEYLGFIWPDLIHPDDRAHVCEAHAQAVEIGYFGPYELRVLRKDGGWSWFESTLTRLSDRGETRGVMVNARDISERKAAAEAVRISEERLRLALEAAELATWDWDLKTNTIVRSALMADFFGVAPQDVEDERFNVLDLIVPEDRSIITDMDRRHLENGEPYQIEYRLRRPNDEIRWLRERARVISTEEAGWRLLGVTDDITEQKAVEQRLRDAEARYRMLVEQIPAVTFVVHIDPITGLAHKDYVSPQIERLLGYTAREWVDDPELSVRCVHPDDLHLYWSALEEMRTATEIRGEVRAIAKDGRELWIRGDATRCGEDEHGNVLWQGLLFDITEEKRAELDVQLQATMLDQAEAAVIGTDPAGVITHWNRYAEVLFGWSSAETLGYPITQFFPNAAPVTDICDRESPVMDASLASRDLLLLRKDGTPVPVHSSTTRLTDANGLIAGYVGVTVDLTERRALEARLEKIAYSDPVTGLPNRALFMERLERALRRTGPGERSVAVLFLDLDRFKVVNDSLGHAAGDILLAQVATRLSGWLRSEDTLARLGGDEFTVLCEGDGAPTHAVALVNRLLAALEQPFTIEGKEAFVGASIGIAFGARGSIGAGELVRRADVALYEAKASGRAQWAIFDEAADDRASKRLALETEFRRAVDRGEFEIYYQPIIDLRTGKISGLEALLRWKHPTRGAISPATFIGLANETGLIVPLGERALEDACREAVSWRAICPEDPPMVSVNVSPRQFHGQRFGQTVRRVLQETGLPPELLTLEVTEESLAENRSATAEFFNTVRSLGVRLALDDFGTGYASLGRLLELPLNALKIDKSFISGLMGHRERAAIVRSVASLAQDLGLTVTAEGIETEEQRSIAWELGCRYGQGYHFAAPMTAERARALIESRRVWSRKRFNPDSASFA